MRRRLAPVFRWTGLVALVLFLGLQVWPGPPRTNPPVNPAHTLQANSPMPSHVSALLDRSCMNCHSNQTHWPWYSYVAPVSWRIVADVEKARKALNFSEWSTGAGRKPALAASMLAASCEDMKLGRMPDFNYAIVHRKAKLNPADVQQFCDWTRTETRRLFALRRQKKT